jgi:hypothetical protein
MSADSSRTSDQQLALGLMQPTFIRVIDHLRLAQERSDWMGQYETLQAWPPQTTPQEQAEVLWLYDRREGAEGADLMDIDRQLEDLPQPIPVYLLHLTKAGQTRILNVWELCYSICLAEYQPQLQRAEYVEVSAEAMRPDDTLLDVTGDINWAKLDQKTAQAVQAAFQFLES